MLREINAELCDINLGLAMGERREFRVSAYGVHRVELMGRLAYCGFEIVEPGEEVIEARKVARAKDEMRAEKRYGLLVRMRRVGKDGKRFDVFKLRTMYRYSEYLQGWMYERYGLNEKGKFKNDYRIMPERRWLRRWWIDELPNVINLIRGEMKIVGVRPLSEQYYSLYSKELQEMRVRWKPGLVPPFYLDASRPVGLKEIEESEMRYLRSCEKRGVWKTDWQYLTNIFRRREIR